MSYWSETFDGKPTSVGEVRRFTMKVLGDRPGVDLVVLVASELAGNAVQHSNSGQPGGKFTVHLASCAQWWQVRIDDAGGAAEPHIRTAVADRDEAGRGLALIEAVSTQWGVVGDHYARAVWAQIPAPEEVHHG